MTEYRELYIVNGSHVVIAYFFFNLDIGYKLKDIFLRAHFDNPGQVYTLVGFAGGSDGKGSTCNEGDLASIPGLGRSPGEGNGNPLQYSCLENPMDGRAW